MSTGTPTSAYANPHANPPPPPPLSMAGGPPQQGPSVLQILAMGQERNHAADAVAHHPRIESLIKLGKESEATWLQIGQTAEAMGDLERAVGSYENALRHNAYSVVALSQIAAICRSKEEFKKAAEYFGRVVGIAPESGDVWGALGHCYLMIDDLKKAYSSYQQALYYMPNPHEPKLWYGIGILYDRYGSLEHAEEAFSSVIRMDPNFEKSNEIFFRLGIIYKQQRKSQQSLDCFRYILHNPPRPLTEIDIWFQIGHVYEQQQDFIAAKESYERVLQENPAHAKVLQQLGGLYHRSHAPFYAPEVSVQILTKSLESDPNDPFSWYLLGRAYMTTNNFGKAYEAYQQAVYRDGKNPAFWCSIGVLYYNINQFHDALDAYSRAIRIHPYLAEVWFNLGALYEACNDQMTDAIDAYQRTLQLDPANQTVAQRLREIREHQSSSAQLSPPPPPKDISPNSSSWNYATNTGGAPAALAQSGLAPEPSPPNGINTNGGSPPMSHAHRFEGGPPGTAGSRPRSTDPYRRHSGTAQQQEARRASGGLHAPHPHPHPHAVDHSPRTHSAAGPPTANGGSRHSGAPGPTSSSAVLPQIKNVHDRPAQMVGPHSRANSPPSPRSRAAAEVSHAGDRYPHSGVHQGPYPFPAHLSHGQHPPPPNQRAAGEQHHAPPYEMDWERSHRGGPPLPPPHLAANSHRNGSSHGRMPPPPPRSPPGSSHSSHGQPFGPPGHHAPHPYDRTNGGRGHFFDGSNGQPPIGYGYPPPPPPPPANLHPAAASSPAAAAAYHHQHQREREEEMARRRSSGSTTSSGKPSTSSGGATSASSALPDSRMTAESPQPLVGAPSGSASAAAPATGGAGRGRGGGRGKKDEAGGEKKESTPRGARKSKAAKEDGGDTTPKRKSKAAKDKEEKAAAKAAAVLNGVLNGSGNPGRSLPPPPPPPPPPAAAASSATPTQLAPPSPSQAQTGAAGETPAPPRPVAPKREVDEDYDEGVDALMGLAASGSTPTQPLPAASLPTPAPRAQPPPPPPPPAPAPALATTATQPPQASATTSSLSSAASSARESPAPGLPPPPPVAPPAAPQTLAPSPLPNQAGSKPTSPNPRKRSLPTSANEPSATTPGSGAAVEEAAIDGQPEPKKSKNNGPAAPSPDRDAKKEDTAMGSSAVEAEEGEIDEAAANNGKEGPATLKREDDREQVVPA
ncbi:hypothetical protein JCM3766R1_006305 [Sporobolomyces carnicolor]